MTKFSTPAAAELPTTHQLNRASLLSVAVATAILVTTILPAEYGIDPTGVGGALGLTPMGEMKRAEASLDAAGVSTETVVMNQPTAAPAAPAASPAAQTGEVVLTLQPNQGEEVKATMQAGGEFEYSWSTDGARVNFELHGERFGAPSSEYTTYEKGTSADESGTFRAPFEGTHGWFWRNRTSEPLTITVRATGDFQKFVLVE